MLRESPPALVAYRERLIAHDRLPQNANGAA
jgi:hypothetical protein